MLFKTNTNFVEIADYVLNSSLATQVGEAFESSLKLHLTKLKDLYQSRPLFDMFDCNFFSVIALCLKG